MGKRALRLAGIGGLTLAFLAGFHQLSQLYGSQPRATSQAAAPQPRTRERPVPSRPAPGAATPHSPAADAEGAEAVAVSALSSYPGFGHDPDADELKYEQEEAEREELIARCMEGAGFKYTPAPSTVVEALDHDSLEDFERALIDATSDPNESYVASLSPEARERYHLRLFGVRDPNSEAEIAGKSVPVAGSCLSEAHERVPGVYAKRNMLVKQLDALDDAVAQDPATRAAYRQWSACMIERGHAFSTPADAKRHADESVMQALEQNSDTAKVADLRAQTDQLASAIASCRERTDLDAQLAGVRARYEDRFVHEHREVLDGPSHLARNVQKDDERRAD